VLSKNTEWLIRINKVDLGIHKGRHILVHHQQPAGIHLHPATPVPATNHNQEPTHRNPAPTHQQPSMATHHSNQHIRLRPDMDHRHQGNTAILHNTVPIHPRQGHTRHLVARHVGPTHHTGIHPSSKATHHNRVTRHSKAVIPHTSLTKNLAVAAAE